MANKDFAPVNKARESNADSNASASANGWSFQVGAGIVLMLDYIKDFVSMKMEGATEDIELATKDGKIYAQAKAVSKMDDRRNVAGNLAEAMRSLSRAAANGDAIKLIYITNISNPLSSKLDSAYRYGDKYEFSVLADEDQKTILEKAGHTFPADKFVLHILCFFGEGENKYERIRERIAEFLREELGDPSYNKALLDRWLAMFMANASDKPANEKSFEMDKKDIIFPVIALVISQPVSESDFKQVCGYDDYDGLMEKFRETLNRNLCDYEFVSGVAGDFLNKSLHAPDMRSYRYEYVKNEWMQYEEQFSAIEDREEREAVIKLLMLTVIVRRQKIWKIKGAANL